MKVVDETLTIHAGPLTLRMGKVLERFAYLYALYGSHLLLYLGDDESIERFKIVAKEIVAEPLAHDEWNVDWIKVMRKEEHWRAGVVQTYIVLHNEQVVGVLHGASSFKLILTALERPNGPAR